MTLAATGANGQPAWAFYRRAPGDTVYRFRAIHVLDIRDGGLPDVAESENSQ